MKNTHKCDECGKIGGHQVWCSLNTEALDHTELAQKFFVATLENGRKQRFSMAPGTTQERAAQYAKSHPVDFDFQGLVAVEEAM